MSKGKTEAIKRANKTKKEDKVNDKVEDKVKGSVVYVCDLVPLSKDAGMLEV
jgi:hypothetical protein